jgi:hypothetical protein
MSGNVNVRRMFIGRAVWGWYLLLVGPLVLGAFDTRMMTPLALPGYFALTIGSAFGSHLFPTLELWVFWGPFLVGAYFVSVALAETFVAFK